MSYEAARIAAYDQAMAQIRDLVQMVHDHHQAGICDGRCPGLKVLTDLVRRPHLVWLDLLLAALIRIEELQSEPQAGAIVPELRQPVPADQQPKPAGRWARILRGKR